ncbi:MAG: hypothetical protein H7Z14_15465 [Anaerolineae bacterium]|nr:hypothetical protein [Phycisphaerae bacterium]
MKSSYIEQLEQRTLLAANPNYIISFYGLGGAGDFGADWLDKTVDDAGAATNSVVRKYNEDAGGRALKDFLRSADRNRNMRIDKAEVATLNVRVIGYSFGGVQAANFARYLAKLGQTVKGYLIGQATPIRALVTLDPVDEPPLKHTAGIPGNVYNYSNYYQQKGGDTTIDLYTDPFDIKVDSITVDDPANIKGEPLPTTARKSNQVRVDVVYADETVKHEVRDNLNGKLTGRNVNHGTLPFFAYDLAVEDLIR